MPILRRNLRLPTTLYTQNTRKDKVGIRVGIRIELALVIVSRILGQTHLQTIVEYFSVIRPPGTVVPCGLMFCCGFFVALCGAIPPRWLGRSP